MNLKANYDIRMTLEIISEFISLGGITHINLDGWNISDDTLFNYEIGDFILNLNKNDNPDNKNIEILKNKLIKMFNEDIKKKIERGYGRTTIMSMKKWDKNIDERTEPYNLYSGGNGCAMRTLSIGLRYYKDEDLDKLIDFSIITSKLTHNSPIGFLGGLASAYFVKLAINNVPIKKWAYMLIDLYESKQVKSHINIEDDNVYFDYRICIKTWKKYIELFFSENKEPLNLKSSVNLVSRFKTFIELEKESNINIEFSSMVGGNGQTSVIMAYNALLDCEGNWEKLVYYGMLHGGDSDTVGAICGGLYGAVYGSKDVPEHLLKYLEMKEKLIELGEKYYELLK